MFLKLPLFSKKIKFTKNISDFCGIFNKKVKKIPKTTTIYVYVSRHNTIAVEELRYLDSGRRKLDGSTAGA